MWEQRFFARSGPLRATPGQPKGLEALILAVCAERGPDWSAPGQKPNHCMTV